MTPKDMVTMRDYVDARINALEDRFAGIDRSTDLAASTASSIVTQIRTENDAKWTAHMQVATQAIEQLEKRINVMEQGKVDKAEHSILDVRIQAIEKAQAKSGQQRFSAGQLAAAAMTVALAAIALELTTVFLLINHIIHT